MLRRRVYLCRNCVTCNCIDRNFLNIIATLKESGWGGHEQQQSNVCQKRTFVPLVMMLQVLLYLRLEKKKGVIQQHSTSLVDRGALKQKQLVHMIGNNFWCLFVLDIQVNVCFFFVVYLGIVEFPILIIIQDRMLMKYFFTFQAAVSEIIKGYDIHSACGQLQIWCMQQSCRIEHSASQCWR
eukprot:TRINITY_DN7467_c0_g1_i4.p3 TRINITY_DN7467_c0_g1~~TRINITY_DN7467_c0_g1_i4.p3  ORF type:complete len:182 (-),score=4.54 TRINITY_DN7467_c0_g1_i4:152-697(-)